MNLIYLSPVPWESFAQRPHKFVDWFHRRTSGDVLWVDPYPTRLPAWQDFRQILKPSVMQKIDPSPSWLHILKPGGVPVEPLPGINAVNGLLWKRTLTLIRDFSSKTGTFLVIGKPSKLAMMVLKDFDGEQSVYDAMDDFPSFYTGISIASMSRREALIVQKVDALWVSSSHLEERWRGSHGKVCLVRNGLDPSVLYRDRVEQHSHKKVFGYVGTLASWFDWEWIEALSDARPGDEIRLIGPLLRRPPRKLPDNVQLWPACDHPSAMKAITGFDVGLIPFKQSTLTASVDPIKYYEYRAAGLPVISQDFGEMSLRQGERGVFISQSLEDIAGLTEAALGFHEKEQDSCAFIRLNTWDARFDSAELF